MTLRRTFLSGAWAPANCDDFKNELTPRTETNPAREYEEQAQSGGLNSTGLGWFGLWFCWRLIDWFGQRGTQYNCLNCTATCSVATLYSRPLEVCVFVAAEERGEDGTSDEICRRRNGKQRRRRRGGRSVQLPDCGLWFCTLLRDIYARTRTYYQVCTYQGTTPWCHTSLYTGISFP